MRADRRTDTHEEGNSRFLQFLTAPQKRDGSTPALNKRIILVTAERRTTIIDISLLQQATF